MSQFKCHRCDAPISLLSSQKTGDLETCLNCAIEQAPLLRYVLQRKSEPATVDEVICQQHYQAHKDRGMGPLSDREIGAGYKQTVTPYSGDRRCECCAEEAERRKGSAA